VNPPPAVSDPPVSPPPAQWFAEEVQAHEASLRSYLHHAFPAVRDVDDVVQESFLRIWKARATQPIRSARAFLFIVARRIAIDLVRRNRISPIASVSHLPGLPVIEDRPGVIEDVGRRERIELLAEAIAGLPARCREVFILHKIQAFSRKEVAAQLGLSEKTVEVQTARAMRRCEAHFRRRGVKGLFDEHTR
jgi:RNA polymerase sigma factor (sigma-70 family)